MQISTKTFDDRVVYPLRLDADLHQKMKKKVHNKMPINAYINQLVDGFLSGEMSNFFNYLGDQGDESCSVSNRKIRVSIRFSMENYERFREQCNHFSLSISSALKSLIERDLIKDKKPL